MPELKHGFGAAKMNKDADERIVPNGEYRDALNIEVSTSEDSDVGTVQILLGNKNITNNQITVSISGNAKCVGSIADEQNNNLYYFIADSNNFTDYIFQYNSNTKTLLPVVVDKYQLNVVTSTSYTSSSANIITNFAVNDATNIRPGMTVQSSGFMTGANTPVLLNVTHEDGLIITKIKEAINPISGNVEWRVYMDETISRLGIWESGISSDIGATINLKSDRALNFKGNQITGINIIDGVIYWTDGSTEPKKIIVDNFIKENIGNPLRGTNISGEIHSNFNVYDKYGVLLQDNYNSIDFRNQPEALKEEHITVIKKSPLHPPAILMSNTSDGRINASGVSNLTSSINDYFIDFDGENLEIGTIKNIIFQTSVDYLVGDLILLRKDEFDDENLEEYELIVEIIEYNANTLEAKVKINFIQNEAVNNVIASSSGSETPIATTFYSMLKQEKPLYEFKLPRFAYRYKYQDNQYSTYSPFSEPAFLPGGFAYSPKEGYNLGMVNTLRSVYIMDFVTDEDAMPKDVVEIDILYKESDSNNIYTVKTIKYSDPEWKAQGSVLNTPGGNYARTTGRIQITSEMVRAAVASNQLLRPWDNVPRTAIAQDIVGNRIVYANYLQNYNL